MSINKTAVLKSNVVLLSLSLFIRNCRISATDVRLYSAVRAVSHLCFSPKKKTASNNTNQKENDYIFNIIVISSYFL